MRAGWPCLSGASERDLLKPVLVAVALAALVALPVAGQKLTYTHYAGVTGGSGYEDGLGAEARFSVPQGIVLDPSGNLYITDGSNHTIRVVTPAGEVTTLAGRAGLRAWADGRGGAARLAYPQGIARALDGTFVFADSASNTIRRVTAGGVVTTIAGQPNVKGSADGTGSQAQFSLPQGLAVHPVTGDIYVVDANNETIRRVTPAGVVTTVAGMAGEAGAVDGVGAAARFSFVSDGAVVVAPDGTLFVADTGNNAIRRIAPDGTVTTFAGQLGAEDAHADGVGGAARFAYPAHIDRDSLGNLYVSDYNSLTIRRISPAAQVTTLAGSPFEAGIADGTGAAARFQGPDALVADASGNVFVCDPGATTIRRISAAGVVTTLCGRPSEIGIADGPAPAARFGQPMGLAVDASGNLYVADRVGCTIRKIAPDDTVTTLAGLSTAQGGNDGQGSAARFRLPTAVAAMPDGTLFVADRDNHTIRKITPAGVVSTLAGTALQPGSTDGVGPAARFRYPWGVSVDATGRVYVADSGNFTIRVIETDGTVSTLAGLAGASAHVDGPAASARFRNPMGIAVDAAGTVYVGETSTIRRIAAGVVSTLAGSPGASGWKDGTGSGALLNGPRALAFDSDGSLLVIERLNYCLRRVTTEGVVTTLAGVAGWAGNMPGTGQEALFALPAGVAVRGGNVYVANSVERAILVGRPALPDIATIDQGQALAQQPRTLGMWPYTASTCDWKVTRRPTGSTAQLSSTYVPSPSFTPDVADLFEFRAKAYGATAQSITSVTLQACLTIPSAPLAGSDTPLCEGQTLHLTATTVPAATYSWTGPGGFASSEQNPVLSGVTAASSGTYSVTVSVDGCTSSAASTHVVVNALPAAPTAGNTGPACAGDTVLLTASSVPGATYAWTGPGGFTSSQQNPALASVTTSASGDYQVVASVNGCPSPPASTMLTVNPRPSAAITPLPALCPATAGHVASVPDSGPGAVYSWTVAGAMLTSPSNGPSITFTTLGEGSVALSVVVSKDGCTANGGTNVSVVAGGAPPVVTAPAPSTIKVNQTLCAPAAGTSLAGLQARFLDQYVSLDAFLNVLPSAVDDCATASRLPTFLAGQAIGPSSFFPVGETIVTFRFEDPAHQVGTATGRVAVRRQGDLDENGAIDLFDIVTLSGHLVGNIPAGTAPFTAIRSVADGNSDTAIDIFDLVILMNHVVGNVACLTP